MKLVIDLLGSDLGAEEIVEGILDSLDFSKSNFVLSGPRKIAEKLIEKRGADRSRFEFIDTDVYITNEDDPARSIRRKKDSSLVLGLNSLNENGYDAFLSAGSTGAILAGGLFITKRIGLVQRATLSAIIPASGGKTILVDTGAVVDSKPEMLNQFAVMGSIYSNKFLKVEKPKVYLLNVGLEEGKGDLLTKEAYKLLSENPQINFMGNIEARDFLTGKADVIVADGFAGNIALKATEGAAKVLLGELKDGIMAGFITKIGGLLLKPVFSKIKKTYDYKEVGAAVLLGLRKPVFKAHGSSDRKAISSAIRNMEIYVNNNITKYIEEVYHG